MTIVWSRHSVRIERTTRSPMPRSLLRWLCELLPTVWFLRSGDG
jgi:hypothetical protein